VWNRTHIRSVQIKHGGEFRGARARAVFTKKAGAIRDVIQNHLFQVLACLAMDPPTGEDHDAIRDEKTRILKAVRPLAPRDIVRGQFKGYRKEAGVAPDSQVETYAAIKLGIDTWRWAGVPSTSGPGKCLPVTCTEVVVSFQRPRAKLSRKTAPGLPNRLRLRFEPRGGGSRWACASNSPANGWMEKMWS